MLHLISPSSLDPTITINTIWYHSHPEVHLRPHGTVTTVHHTLHNHLHLKVHLLTHGTLTIIIKVRPHHDYLGLITTAPTLRYTPHHHAFPQARHYHPHSTVHFLVPFLPYSTSPSTVPPTIWHTSQYHLHPTVHFPVLYTAYGTPPSTIHTLRYTS